MEEWPFGLPACVKVGVSFIGILFLNSIGLALGLSIMLFSIILSIWSGACLAGLNFQFTSFALPENYLLPIVVSLLLLVVGALGKTGRIERTVQALQGMFKNKKTLFAGLPALIGNNPAAGTLAAATTLAYSSGYLGMMFSPLHVCFVVTCEYYSTRMTGFHRYIADLPC